MIENKTAHTKLGHYSSTDLEGLRETTKSLPGQLVSQLTLQHNNSHIKIESITA